MDATSAERWRRAAEAAEARKALATTEHLREAGIGRGAVEKALRSGRLVRVHTGVFSFGHAPLDRPAEWLAAVLACGDGTALGLRSAGRLWDLREAEPLRVEVVSPTGCGRSRPGIVVHQSPLGPLDCDVRLGVPVTSVARTIADLAHELPPDEIVRMVREAQYRKLLHLPALELANRRRPSRALGAILEDIVPTDSWLEDRFLTDVVARHGLPAPQCQVLVEGFRVDFLWEREKLIAEVDGAQHATTLRMQADRIRDNALHLAGYLVLRYTTADVRRRHARAAAQIRRALRR